MNNTKPLYQPWNGFVYVVEAGGFDAVKIGTASDFRKRIAQIQTGCPEKLKLLYVFDGDRSTEKELHAMFSECRLHGEWFKKHPYMMAYLDLLHKQYLVQQKSTPERESMLRNSEQRFYLEYLTLRYSDA